jgi:uncharacterized protein YbjQ (UPF0145 family)
MNNHYFTLAIYLIPLVLLALGFFVGRILERSHYRSIHEREAKFAATPCLNCRTVPRPEDIRIARLVSGSVVVSVDRFKQFLAALRNIFGGEVNSYATLIDRARREAILRMKEQAPTADLFVNLKLETLSISKGGNRQTGTVEVLAYGTAIRYGQSG